ncbi:radical SAM protein [Microbispora sp. NBC_01189]|uniref:radical SAM/SPASM domain-containing protein n=1 Tax=Microbispora sp. NBC_01189 TaxID=2903583 RepID=UPI002E0E5C4B|nr:radical SAM protein [Microbispora sp. NBC_01189]
MVTPHALPPATLSVAPVYFLELEITGRCQLTCSHCYAESRPTSGHGAMTLADWKSLLTSAPAAGITTVQLIGGEPTQHPNFGQLLTHALAQGLKVQVFSNLYRITDRMWGLLNHPNVTLATSYYSDDPDEHDRITGRAGSHARTLSNIIEALRRGIPLKVAIVQLSDEQRAQQAHNQMRALGVNHLGPIDRMRGVGRGAATIPTGVGELCGQCGDGRAAVSPNGDVSMCVMSRFLPPAGNVKTTPLADIFAGVSWINLLTHVPGRSGSVACKPGSDGNDCAPAETVCEGDALTLPRQRRPLFPAVATALLPAMAAGLSPSGGDSNDRGPASH